MVAEWTMVTDKIANDRIEYLRETERGGGYANRSQYLDSGFCLGPPGHLSNVSESSACCQQYLLNLLCRRHVHSRLCIDGSLNRAL
jgi:hypothetical protein